MDADWLAARRREAWALIRRGDPFQIGRRFLIRHGLV